MLTKAPRHKEGVKIADYLNNELQQYCIEIHALLKNLHIQDDSLKADYMTFMLEYSDEPQYEIFRLIFMFNQKIKPDGTDYADQIDIFAKIITKTDELDKYVRSHEFMDSSDQAIKVISEIYYVFGKMTVNEIVEKLVADGHLEEYEENEDPEKKFDKELLDNHQRRIYRYIQKYPSFAELKKTAFSKQQFISF